MNLKFYFFLVVIGMIAISSCKKLEPLSLTSKPVTLSGTIDTDVYVAGVVYAADGTTQIASFWKNGKLHKLSDSTSNASAQSVAVHDTDVLISGTIDHVKTNSYTAVYYRNGKTVVLADNASVGMAQSMFITGCGCDFYVCGAIYVNGKTKAVYWKNGVLHMLPGKSPQTYANGIVVHGNNVYVAGLGITTQNTVYGIYWRNDTAYNLSDTLSDSRGQGISVSGNDVYVAGVNRTGGRSVATYWKNGTPVVLDGSSNPNQGTSALSIVAKGSDLYAAGAGGPLGQGSYWVNNTLIPLPNNTYQPGADGIAVQGNDVYVAGWGVFNGTTVKPAYFKNGTFVQLPATQGQGLGIAVVTRSH
jgi:hypothetical protein